MHLLGMVHYWAKVDPHRHALVQPDLITTYGALATAIQSAAERIGQLGLDHQEPIGVSIAHPSFLVVAALAGLDRGYDVALLRPDLLPLLPGAGIRNLIYDNQGLILSGGRNVRFDPSWVRGSDAKSQARPSEPVSDKNGGAIIFFTSGTTGLPKKVIQPAAATDQLLNYSQTCASGPGAKILIMPGLSTTFGFNKLAEVLTAGKTAYLAPDNQTALLLVTQREVDVLVSSAAQATALVETKVANPEFRTKSLKEIFVGGGKITTEAIRAIRSTLCRNVINQYGSTEAGVAALTPFSALHDEPGAIPLPWTQLQIVDEAGELLPNGSEGHIRYLTPQLSENIKVAGPDGVPGVRDGWFYPGDIGTMGSDGILRFAGRSSEVLNRGGMKVSATKIEEVLKGLPAIKDAAACNVFGRSGLEEIWIAIVPKGEVDIDHVKEALKSHRDIAIAPDEVFVLDQLPVGELGKVQKIRLKEELLRRKEALA